MVRHLIILTTLVVTVVLPAAAGLLIVENARYNRYFDNGPQYLRHVPAADNPDTLMAELGYQVHDVARDGVPVPRVFIADLPPTLPALSPRMRKQVFTHVLLPLILRVNEIILEDRARIIELRDKVNSGARLSDLEAKWLLEKSSYYRLKAPGSAKGVNFDELLLRSDVIPSSLAIAQAAIESGWGQSRFAQEGNALFGQWVWGSSRGIVPSARDNGATHRIADFDYLIQSVMSYARNLNTHVAYTDFRARRAALREDQTGSIGYSLAAGLSAYSEDGEGYVQKIRTVIASNGFHELESASLEPAWWASRQTH